MKKLRPCPFCGSEDVKLMNGWYSSAVVCFDCGAGGPDITKRYKYEPEREKIAMKQWNKRASDDAMLDAADEIEASADPCLRWLVRLLREEAGR